MKKNVGKTDKNIRILLGTIILAVGIYFQSWWGLFGIVLILTALFSWCPAYVPFGISTCKTNKKNI